MSEQQENAVVESEAVEVDATIDDPLAEAFTHEKKQVDDVEVDQTVYVETDPEPEDEKGKERETAMPAESDGVKGEKTVAEADGIMAAYMAEKKKRQLYEQQLQQLQQRQQKQEPEPEFDWTDPKKTIKQETQRLEQQFTEKLLNMSEYACKQRHEDYDQKYELFTEMALNNPAIINQMLTQADPAEWAYQQASKQAAMREIGDDPVAYREKLKEEIKAQLLHEMGGGKKNDIEEKIQKAAGIPPAAAGLRAKATNSSKDLLLDDPLASVFGSR